MGRSQGRADADGRPESSVGMIRAAEARSFFGAHPKWLDPKDSRLQAIRDRGYRFCLDRKKADDRFCEDDQDRAAQLVRLLPLLLKDFERIAPAERTPVQQALATSPDLAKRAEDFCWTLYPAGDAADARILGACLSNLTGGGFVVQIPVS